MKIQTLKAVLLSIFLYIIYSLKQMVDTVSIEYPKYFLFTSSFFAFSDVMENGIPEFCFMIIFFLLLLALVSSQRYVDGGKRSILHNNKNINENIEP